MPRPPRRSASSGHELVGAGEVLVRAHVQREVAGLGVRVHHEDGVAARGERGRERLGGGGLGYAALLVGEGDDPGGEPSHVAVPVLLIAIASRHALVGEERVNG